jgi:hypothetical protein
MEFLKPEEAISVAKRELRIADTQEHDDLLYFWADEAIRHLVDPENTVTKTVELEVLDGNKVCLPKGCQTVVGFGYCEDGCMCMDFFIGHNKCRDYFNIVGNWIIFNECVKYEKCFVVYEGLGKDCDGETYLAEYQERAVRAYVRWRFKFTYPEMFTKGNPWKVDEREYVAQKGFCKGQTAVRKFRENKFAINQIFNRTSLRMWDGAGYNYTWG